MTAYSDAVRDFHSTTCTLEQKLDKFRAARTVRAIKIDPREKTVEFVHVPCTVSRGQRVEISASSDGLREALDPPEGCSIDRMSIGRIERLVYWDDLEHMDHAARNALPGFTVNGQRTLRGPAIVYAQIEGQTPCEREPLTITMEMDEDALETIRASISFLAAEDVLASQMREIEEEMAKIQALQEQGRLQNTQVIHLKPT